MESKRYGDYLSVGGLGDLVGQVADCWPQASRIQIVANDAEIKSDGSEWKPIWRHETELGHDKALSIKEGRAQAAEDALEGEIPLIIFIGDGVSDLPAAREADVLFARKGLRLEEYCIENKIPYIGFDSFSDVKREVEAIMKEDQEKTKGVGKPARFNPRANMWRRISSRQAVSSSFISMETRSTVSDYNNRFRSSSLPHHPGKRRCSSGQKASPNTAPRMRPRIPEHEIRLQLMCG